MTVVMNPPFLAGILFGLNSVASLLFAKFWNRTRDRLFLGFSCSFGLLAIERIALYVIGVNDETQTWVYWIRFIAFVLLVLAIIDKNRASQTS